MLGILVAIALFLHNCTANSTELQPMLPILTFPPPTNDTRDLSETTQLTWTVQPTSFQVISNFKFDLYITEDFTINYPANFSRLVATDLDSARLHWDVPPQWVPRKNYYNFQAFYNGSEIDSSYSFWVESWAKKNATIFRNGTSTSTSSSAATTTSSSSDSDSSSAAPGLSVPQNLAGLTTLLLLTLLGLRAFY